MSRTILVCQHQTCPRQGAALVLQAFSSQVSADVVVQSVGCLGECGNGPMVVVLPDEIWYCHVAPEDVRLIVKQHLQGGKPVREKLYPKFHPSQQSLRIWLIVPGLFVGFLGLLFWFIASQTYYF
jgi:(2Fe-2S) ferredoxin